MKLIFNLFDPYSEVRQQAADRNWFLYGYDAIWMILDGTGEVISTDDTPVKALTKAIFTPTH